MMSDGEIVTCRLRLRRLREDDETRVVAYRSDARASRYLNHPPMGPGEFRDWFAERSPEWTFDRPGHRRFYGIDERSSGLLIGDAVLVRSADGREGAIGMFLDPATSGLGYSLEIGQALLAAAFEGFGLIASWDVPTRRTAVPHARWSTSGCDAKASSLRASRAATSRPTRRCTRC